MIEIIADIDRLVDCRSGEWVPSEDRGSNWKPIAGNLSGNSLNVQVKNILQGTQYLLKVIATGGFNTCEDISDGVFSINKNIYLPFVSK